MDARTFKGTPDDPWARPNHPVSLAERATHLLPTTFDKPCPGARAYRRCDGGQADSSKTCASVALTPQSARGRAVLPEEPDGIHEATSAAKPPQALAKSRNA